MIPEQAIAAGLAAWGQYPVGVSPKRQMANILEAAAPYMLSLTAVEIGAVEDMVKAAKADGFDEGQKSGMRHADRLAAAAKIGRPELPGPISPNPYRITR